MQVQIQNLIERVAHLPEETQNNLLFFWNEDIENEINFDSLISETSDKINLLARDALKEFKNGNTIEWSSGQDLCPDCLYENSVF